MNVITTEGGLVVGLDELGGAYNALFSLQAGCQALSKVLWLCNAQ